MLNNTPESSTAENSLPPDNGVTESPAKEPAAKPRGRVRKIPICWFYSRYKACKFEENCRFRHSEPNAAIKDHKKNTNSLKAKNGHVDAPVQAVEGQLTNEPKSSDAEDKNDLPHEEAVQSEGETAEKQDKSILNTEQNKENVAAKQNRVKERRKKTSCYFFRRFKSCKFGERCDFSHENPHGKKPAYNKKDDNASELQSPADDKTSQEKPEADDSDFKTIRPQPSASQNLNTRNIPLSSLNSDLLKEFRQIELSQLKKRFRGKNIEEADGKLFVLVKATDPDWPFEVSSMWIEVEIPKDYPKEMLKITVSSEKNDLMPHLLTKFLNNTISSWLNERHNTNQKNEMTELVFRCFLRWFDRQMENLFIEGLNLVKRHMEAKAAGLEFVSPDDLKISPPEADNTVSTNENKSNVGDEPNVILVKNKSDESYQPLDLDVKSACLDLLHLSVKPGKEASLPVNDSKEQKGTAIKAIDYTLSENVATLICSKISVVVQCTRCRSKCDFDGNPRRTQKLTCQKCNHIMNVTFRSTILHQYSAVIGYLDLEGCKAFDVILLKCEFNVTCLNCNKSFSVMSLCNGRSNTSFCLKCHTKTEIMFSTFKFQVFDPPSFSNQVDTKLIKAKKELKDSAIQDGKPLPDNGICKHYKKSFRWMRFPCCGKCYPCDLCHDEKEFDHEMKYAARMLCGFCAKEQTYSADKPCMRCHSNLTKKSQGHWNNGQGCRDKVKMSKDDKQKYSGLHKTTALKVEDKKAAKKNKQ